jgi:hypothetical protein
LELHELRTRSRSIEHPCVKAQNINGMPQRARQRRDKAGEAVE